MSVDNRILMLTLICMGSKKAWIGITKLQKLSFLLEYYLLENDKRAFDYEFFMYDLGPISTEVYDDFEFLINEELVVENERGIRPSEQGERIVEQFQSTIPKEINSVMQHVVNEYAPMKTDNLVEKVHNIKMKLLDETIVCIGDLPRNFILLPKALHTAFKMKKDYVETFRILSDKPLVEAIRQARRRGLKSEKYEPLTSS